MPLPTNDTPYLMALARALVARDEALARPLLDRVTPAMDTQAVVLEAMAHTRRTDLLAQWLPHHPAPHADGAKVLFQAICQKLDDWIAPLLATLTPPDLPTRHRGLPLAASRGQTEVVRQLYPYVQKLDDLNLALMCACEAGQASCVAVLRPAIEAQLDRVHEGSPKQRAQFQRKLLDNMLISTASHPNRDLWALLQEGEPGPDLARDLAKTTISEQDPSSWQGWGQLCAHLPLSQADRIGHELLRKSSPAYRDLDQLGPWVPTTWQAQWLTTYGAAVLPQTDQAHRARQRQQALAHRPAGGPVHRRHRA